jgi:hypothetical protein
MTPRSRGASRTDRALFIDKPFDFDDLRRSVREALEDDG